MSDDKQLATIGNQSVATTEQPTMLQAVMSAAMNPSLDPERIKAFLDMAREMDQEQKKQEFNRAFAAAHAQISQIHIKKNGEIVYPGKGGGGASVIKFIKHDDISKAIKPVLAANGLTASYSSEMVAGAPKVCTIMTIIHANGYSREWRSIPMPLVDSGGGKNDVQGAGSVSTYGRRFVTVAAFDIVAEDHDDDGNLGRGLPGITQDQADMICDIIRALEDKQPGKYQAPFFKWIATQFKVDTINQIKQGAQHAEVMAKLDTAQKAAGLKK